MRHENDQNTNNYSEAAEDTASAVSASEIFNRENSTGKLWLFIGGLALGSVAVIAAALVADALTYGEGEASEQPNSEEKKMLALPEGDSSS